MSALTDIAFTPAVKAAQEKYGVRDFAARLEDAGHPREMPVDLARFIATRDSAYLATASADGQPYIQHRGGPAGFIKVIDSVTLGFAEYPGNKQLISTGNLAENGRAFLFLMDYATRQRVKLWGRAAIVDDPDFVARVSDTEQPRVTGRALRFVVDAWDLNCPSFITQRFTEHDLRLATAKLVKRIADLEAEIARLKGERT